MGGQQKRFYGEMWGNASWGGETHKNPKSLSMYDGPIQTDEYMWVNICCMLDLISGFCHKSAEIHFLDIQ